MCVGKGSNKINQAGTKMPDGNHAASGGTEGCTCAGHLRRRKCEKQAIKRVVNILMEEVGFTFHKEEHGLVLSFTISYKTLANHM